MPRYTYECGECGHRVEEIHSMSVTLSRDCPKCGEESFDRVIFAPAISIQGTGSWEPPPVHIRTDRYGKVSSGHTVEQLNRREAAEFNAAKRTAERLRRKEGKQGHRSSFRHIGSVPISEYASTQKKFGKDAFREGNTVKTLKKLDRYFGND